MCNLPKDDPGQLEAWIGFKFPKTPEEELELPINTKATISGAVTYMSDAQMDAEFQLMEAQISSVPRAKKVGPL